MRDKFVTILFVPFMTKNNKPFFLFNVFEYHVHKKLSYKKVKRKNHFLQSFINTHTDLPANIRLGWK
jgi:hypothetical protein